MTVAASWRRRAFRLEPFLERLGAAGMAGIFSTGMESGSSSSSIESRLTSESAPESESVPSMSEETSSPSSDDTTSMPRERRAP